MTENETMFLQYRKCSLRYESKYWIHLYRNNVVQDAGNSCFLSFLSTRQTKNMFPDTFQFTVGLLSTYYQNL